MRRGPGADGRLNTGAVDPSRGAGAFQPQRDHRKPHVAGLTAQTRAGRAAARSQPATRPRCRRRAASMSAEPCRGGYGARPGSRMGAEANACARRFVDLRAELGSDRLPDPAGRRRESSPFPLAKVLRLTLRAPNRAPTSRHHSRPHTEHVFGNGPSRRASLYAWTADGFAARHSRMSSAQHGRHQQCRPLSVSGFGLN